MPRPTDSPDIAASKTLSYILRHGAEKEQLHIRSDGFIKLNDILARPKLRDVDITTVLRLVNENTKQRFELLYGYDPSPPLPKAKQKSKKVYRRFPIPSNDSGKLDAAAVDDVSVEVGGSVEGQPIELPLLTLPAPPLDQGTAGEESLEGGDGTGEAGEAGEGKGGGGDGEGEGGGGRRGDYFIRATQGHSIKLESTAHLEPVRDDKEGQERVGLMVHGTRWELWDQLKEEGLSRMSRQHIHLAPALSDHRITPRSSSTLLIYLDLGRVLDSGISVYTSSNGVVLTPGDGRGVVPRGMWRKAERVIRGERVVVWEGGKEVVLPIDQPSVALGTG